MGSSLQEILDEEKLFYESDTRDRLKVPPFTYVGRIPRGHVHINERMCSNKFASAEDLINKELEEDWEDEEPEITKDEEIVINSTSERQMEQSNEPSELN